MNGFVIEKLNNDEYDLFLLCLSFESIVNYLNDIESSEQIVGKSGVLLIDQLLVTGNSDNRFISCKYISGKIDINSTTKVIPEERMKELSLRLLSENKGCYKNSILTSYERQCIDKGIIF